MHGTTVIIGAGQSGAQAAASLRENGWMGRVILIGDEPRLPYQRPPLSKSYLKGEIRADQLDIWPAPFYRERGIELILDTPARRIDPRTRIVTLEGGAEINFDRLILATGTRARLPPIAGSELEGVVSLRSARDVDRLRLKLDSVETIVIVGGGYIGLEVAAALRGTGRAVTIVEAEDRLLKRVTAEPTGRFFEALHQTNGVAIRLETKIAGITGENTATGIKLFDGTTLGADLILLAAGAQPNTEIAEAAGIAVEDGVLVDRLGETSINGIFACGDCARYQSLRYGRSVRIESVQNAIEQARAVATTISGKPTAYDPVPWFWSDQYRTKLQIAGLYDPSADVTTEGCLRKGPFVVEYRHNGRLIAVDAIDKPRAHMLARRHIAEATGKIGNHARIKSKNDPRVDESEDREDTQPLTSSAQHAGAANARH